MSLNEILTTQPPPPGNNSSPQSEDSKGGNHNTAKVGQGVGWEELSWILLADVIGSSVLTFAGVAATVGWVTCIFVFFFCGLSIYAALLMSRTFCILRDSKGKTASTMGEASRLIFNSDRAAFWTYAVVYGIFAFLGNSSYLLVLGTCLVDAAAHPAILDREMCPVAASALACALLVPLVVSVRRLTDSPYLYYANFLLIVAALIICLVKIGQNGKVHGAHTHFVQPNLSLLPFFGSMGNVCYAFTGHWMYFEMMAEMKNPETFPKVFYINAPLQLLLYLVVTITGYYFLGDTATGYLPSNLPAKSTERAIVSVLLFCHIAIAYLIKSISLSRYVCSVIAPSMYSLEHHDEASLITSAVKAHSPCAKRSLYCASAIAFLIGGWMVANAIPVFDELLGLVGSVLSAPISFILPIIFFLLALDLPILGLHTEPLMEFSTPPRRRSAVDWCRAGFNTFWRQRRGEKILLITLVVTVISIMVLGSADEVKRIVDEGSFTFGC